MSQSPISGYLDPRFLQLDKESQKLRMVAKDIANFLSTCEFELSTKSGLIKALKIVSTSRIDKIDGAFNYIKKEIINTTLELKEKKKFEALSKELSEQFEILIIRLNTES